MAVDWDDYAERQIARADERERSRQAEWERKRDEERKQAAAARRRAEAERARAEAEAREQERQLNEVANRHGVEPDQVAVEAHRLRVHRAALALDRPAFEPPAELTDDDLEAVLEGDYLIEGMLPMDQNVVITGLQGTGKSTFAGQLCMESAEGQAFLGRFATQPTSWGWIDLEQGRADLARQFASQGWSADMDMVRPMPVESESISLTGEEGDHWANWVNDEMLDGLVIDNLIKAALPYFNKTSSMNDTRPWADFYADLAAWRTRVPDLRTLIFIAHAPKSSPDDVEGSAQTMRWAGQVWALISDRRGNRKLKNKKPRDHLGQIAWRELDLVWDPERHRSTVRVSNATAATDPGLKEVADAIRQLDQPASQRKIQEAVERSNKWVRPRLQQLLEVGVVEECAEGWSIVAP